MHMPDPVETVLARLMPPGLSAEAQSDIEAMLDELAGPAGNVLAVKPWFRRPIVGGIAASGIAAALLLAFAVRQSPVSPALADSKASPGIVLVGESDSIESMTEEGWQEDSDGSAMRALHLSVVEENQLLDEETGIVMLVSEPREELLLMPVSTF